ncbi:MAG: hypothetical protein OEW84_03010 [Aigarchaeota archaeon]|nr:hypothetical protein [Aigarchaeota archaeon]
MHVQLGGMRAYLLAEVYPGKEKEFLKKAKSFPAMVSVDLVHGAFDMVMLLDGDLKTIDETIMKVRSLQGIRRTETLLGFEKFPIPSSTG